jgi:hypothetical protein
MKVNIISSLNGKLLNVSVFLITLMIRLWQLQSAFM